MDPYLKTAFRAVVDAIIPAVLQCRPGASAYWIVGAAGLSVEEFVMKQIDHSQFIPAGAASGEVVPLSLATAIMLDIGTAELTRIKQPSDSITAASSVLKGAFAALSRMDRLRTIALINRLAIPLQALPFPYRNNPGLVQTMMDSLHQLTVFGYYSEWYGLGSTRLSPPNNQRVEFFPPGWRIAGYPGPSYGYRAFRGFILTLKHKRGGET